MKHYLLILFLIGAYSAQADEKECLRDSIIDYAKEHIGIPYVYGGTTTNGFDCSGFVYYVFKKFGIAVSRASSGYEGKGETVDLALSKPADIMLFTGTDATRRKVGHVGIVVHNDNGTIDFIHSSSGKKRNGVIISRYNESGYVKRFLRAITVL